MSHLLLNYKIMINEPLSGLIWDSNRVGLFVQEEFVLLSVWEIMGE